MVANCTTRGSRSSPVADQLARSRSRLGPDGALAEVSAHPDDPQPLASLPAGVVAAGGLHGAAEIAATPPGHACGGASLGAVAPSPIRTLAAIQEADEAGASDAVRDAAAFRALEGRLAQNSAPLPAPRASRSGEMGRLCAEEMEKILDAVKAEDLRAPLENEGLLATMRFLEVGGGGLRSPAATGLAYREARARLVLHARRGGSRLADADLCSLIDRVVRITILREAESADRDRGLCDGLLDCVTRQQHGKPLTAMMTPTLGDIVLASEALSHNPAPLPSLSLSSRMEDTLRHKKDKVFEHKRGSSADEEYRLLEEFLCGVGQRVPRHSLYSKTALTQALDKHLELQAKGVGSGRKRSRDYDSGSESGWPQYSGSKKKPKQKGESHKGSRDGKKSDKNWRLDGLCYNWARQQVEPWEGGLQQAVERVQIAAIATASRMTCKERKWAKDKWA
ncbi:MAG: hypothetical protein SGPRY_001595 [Prymnesium sp.]